MNYVLRDCKLADLRAIAGHLRQRDMQEAEAAAIKPRHLLNTLWRESFVQRVAFVDGTIAAVWGCCGSLCAGEANPWLFTTQAIERAPLAFFREARREIAELLAFKHVLETGVMADYTSSIRFWKMIGFAVVGEYSLQGRPFLKLRMERA